MLIKQPTSTKSLIKETYELTVRKRTIKRLHLKQLQLKHLQLKRLKQIEAAEFFP